MIAIIIIIILIAIGIYYYITLPIKVMDNSNSKIVSNVIPPPQYPTRMGYCDSTMDRCPNIIESSEDGASIKFDENTGLYCSDEDKEYTVLDFRFSGTSLLIIRKAMPSAMAVLPTPGSPIKMGLFLVRLDKI